ncbi:unnamed protein product [Heterosigma akashiwo]
MKNQHHRNKVHRMPCFLQQHGLTSICEQKPNNWRKSKATKELYGRLMLKTVYAYYTYALHINIASLLIMTAVYPP